jgi:hypothetical protein
VSKVIRFNNYEIENYIEKGIFEDKILLKKFLKSPPAGGGI